ncbi:MAG: hypothetical protein BA863_10420 [Desulfovibrio sp. S3730MH75]|nr:MAG: hypothetical protein BA863_10420 [Desulfovibrio sp. S3730MH75]
MPGKYAKDTSVSVEKSKAEIEQLVIKYGADGFSTSWRGELARIEFMIDERWVRISLVLPDKNSNEYQFTETGRERSQPVAYKEWEKSCRSMWRKLKLIIQAKLEAVDAGISTVDREFMPDIVMPDQKTLGEHLVGAIGEAYDTGTVKGLLPEYK